MTPPVLFSINKSESHKGPNSCTTPIAPLGLLVAIKMAINKTAIETFIHTISTCGELRKGRGDKRRNAPPTPTPQKVYNLNGDNEIKNGS